MRKIRPILETGEVMGGFFYIQVVAQDKLYPFVLKANGIPETTLLTSAVYVRKFYVIGSHHSTVDLLLSLRDVNVIPCMYSNCSLWPYNEQTRLFLNKLVSAGVSGYEEYASILTKHKRWTPFEILRKHNQNFL